MKHTKVSLMIVLLLTVGFMGRASAVASGTPSEDIYVRYTDPFDNYDELGISAASASADCDPIDVSYLQWLLEDIPAGALIGAANLTLTTEFATGTAGATVGLYEVADDAWEETTLVADDALVIGSLIQSVAAPTLAGQTLTFNNAGLVTYLNAQAAGDNIVSMALMLNGGCLAGDLVAVRFADAEDNHDPPSLQLESPTNTKIQTLRASPRNSQPILGKIALAGILLITLVGIWQLQFEKHRSHV